MCTISIAVATYNGAKYIKEQIDSLLHQTRMPDEIVIVDDCSTDETVGIIRNFQNDFPFIRIIENKKNVGVNGNFVKALKHCNGDYIVFCDQDDIWRNEKVQVLFSKMKEIEKKGEPAIVSSSAICVNNEMKHVGRMGPVCDNHDFRLTVLKHYSQGCTMIINRECLKYISLIPSYNNRTKICFDYVLGLIVSFTGIKYDLCADLMFYRRHGGNVTSESGNNKRSLKERIKDKFQPNIVHKDFIATDELVYDYLFAVGYRELPVLEDIVRIHRSKFVKKLALVCSLNYLPRMQRLRVCRNIIINAIL